MTVCYKDQLQKSPMHDQQLEPQDLVGEELETFARKIDV